MKYIIALLGFILIVLNNYPHSDIVIDKIDLALFFFSSIILLLENKSLNHFLERISEFKLWGATIKLSEKTKEMVQNIEKLEERIEKKSSSISSLPEDFSSGLAEKLSNPKAAIFFIAYHIDSTLEELHAKNSEDIDSKTPIAALKIAKELKEKKVIDSDTENLFINFWNVRNLVIHGKDKENISNNYLLEFVDIGTRILKILNAIKN